MSNVKLSVNVKQVTSYLDLMELFYTSKSIFEELYDIEFNINDMIIGDIQMISIDSDSSNMDDIKNIIKLSEKLSSEIKDLLIITAEEQKGIEAINFSKDILTGSLMKFLSLKQSIVKKIKMTSVGFPEQYECFDEYGNQVAYLRLRYGAFTVECPDIDGTLVYAEFNRIKGYGNFDNTAERIYQLKHAFDAIDSYFNTKLKTISIELSDECEINYVRINPEYSIQRIMEDLYDYQMSNFTAKEVLDIRKKGPTIGYEESIRKLIREHRLVRSNMFPEADGSNGLSDKHIEHELEFFKSTIDGLGGYMKTINWLFDKSFEDFEKIFREYSKKGSNSI